MKKTRKMRVSRWRVRRSSCARKTPFATLFLCILSTVMGGLADFPVSSSLARADDVVVSLSTESGFVASVGMESDDAQLSAQILNRMGTFIRDTLVVALPPDVQARLSRSRFDIRLVPEVADRAAVDGLFIPPGDDSAGSQIRIRSALMTGPDWKPLLAHEFFHAVHHVLHPGEEPWVREGLAQLFETMVLGSMNGVNLAAAFKDPSTPLMGRYSIERPNPAQYGHDLLYFHYLKSQCGGDGLVWKLASGASGETGRNGIDRELRASSGPRLPQCESFEASARHFEIARMHNQITYAEPANRRIHFLLSTTLPGPAPASGVSAAELARLEPFQPLLLQARASVGSAAGLERYWLKRKFPYNVVQEAPPEAGSADWVQVIFRR